MKGIYSNSFVENMILKNYSFSLSLSKYRRIRPLLDKYFKEDWGFVINDKYKGLFSFKRDTFSVECTDGTKFFDSLIEDGIIDYYEVCVNRLILLEASTHCLS